MVYRYNVETKLQSTQSVEKILQVRLIIEVILMSYSDISGLMHYQFLPK